jgi:hypothetical protein
MEERANSPFSLVRRWNFNIINQYLDNNMDNHLESDMYNRNRRCDWDINPGAGQEVELSQLNIEGKDVGGDKQYVRERSEASARQPGSKTLLLRPPELTSEASAKRRCRCASGAKRAHVSRKQDAAASASGANERSERKKIIAECVSGAKRAHVSREARRCGFGLHNERAKRAQKEGAAASDPPQGKHCAAAA